MENITSDLEDLDESSSEMKQSKSKLGRMWKDLLGHIESTRNELQTQIGALENQLEAKASELQRSDKLSEEKLQEVELGKQHLYSLQLLIQEHEEELSLKEKQFSDVQRRVREKERECDVLETCIRDHTKTFQEFEEEISLTEKRLLDVQRSFGEKEREYDLIEKRIQNRTQRLNWLQNRVEKQLGLVEFREREVKHVRGQLDKCSQKFELKEKQLNEILWSIKAQENEFSLKEEQINEAHRSLGEYDIEIKLKEEKLSSIQKSIVGCSSILKLREREIREMDMKVQGFCLLKKEMEEWSCKVELKEKLFESKVEELTKRINEGLNEVQLKEEHFASQEKLIQERGKHLDLQEQLLQECSNGLEIKERQLEHRAKELELKQHQMDSTRKSTQEDTQHLDHAPANMATVPSSTSNQSTMNNDGRGLQLLMNDHLKIIDLLSSKMSAHLKTSSDPAKLVLDAMQGFYPSNLVVVNLKFDFDLTVIRRSCVLLLQELKRLSPQINPRVREEAIKLAADWKAKMTVASENSLEILGFLWLLTAFKLTSTYNATELQRLLGIVPETEQATALCQALGITDKAPGSTPFSPIKIEAICSPSLQPSSTSDARNCQGSPNEHLSDHSGQEEIFDGLQYSSDPAKLALTIMQKSLFEYLRTSDVGLEATVLTKNISMLKELTKLLQHVEPHVKKDAKVLAVLWKARMRVNSDNSLETFCFLKFLSTYGLLSTFDVDEIVKLLGMISQHKQALELRQTPGFADKIPDYIQNLIERKQLREALRFIFTFKLTDKFPPVEILKTCVEVARQSYWSMCRENISVEEKEKSVDDKIADLKAVIQCIQDYNLESQYASKDVEIQIGKLEKLKETWRRLAGSSSATSPPLEHGLEKRKKRSRSTCAPNFLPPEKHQANEAARPYALTAGYFRLTSSSEAVLYGLPTSTPAYQPQLSLSSQLYEHPAQLAMAASNRDIGANFGANAMQMQLSSSSLLYENSRHPLQLSTSSLPFENYGHSAQFGVAADGNVLGADFGAIHDDPIFPFPPSQRNDSS